MATRIDGKALAAKVKAQTAEAAKSLYRRPGLAVILVGNDPASRVYVTGKEKDCAECGFLSFEHALPEDTTQETLLDLIQELNRDPQVDGILCQLPLPGHLDEEAVLNAIARDKDVDCFHPYNVGRLMIGDPVFLPCTPAGVMEMLREYGIPVRGRRCVVLGRSNIVGKPMAMLLLQQDGTVTVQDAGTGGHHPGGGHPGVRCGPGGSCHAGYGEGRGRGHRRGHEPEQRGQALRRCRLRRGRTQGILHHSGARRRGAHDPGHADAQYPHRSPEPPGGEVNRRKERRGFWPRRS